MACGCRGAQQPSTMGAGASAPAQEARRTVSVAEYTVMKAGEPVVVTTSPTAARSEAKRVGGSVSVSSRVATPDEATALAGAR